MRLLCPSAYGWWINGVRKPRLVELWRRTRVARRLQNGKAGVIRRQSLKDNHATHPPSAFSTRKLSPLDSIPTCEPATGKARADNGENMVHPRAADDFAVIRGHLQELRRKRGEVSVAVVRPMDPRPYSPASGETKHDAQRQIIRAWFILAIVNLVTILLLTVLSAAVYYRIPGRAVLFFAQLLHGSASP
jgi:hypothetical protein